MDLTCSFQMINQSAFIKHRVQKFDAVSHNIPQLYLVRKSQEA